MAKVYFNQDCPLCKELARLSQSIVGGKIAFLPWQDHFQGTPVDIAVELDGKVVHGLEAWTWICQNYPILRGLDWFAGRLGFSSRKSGQMLRGSAHLLKKFCRKCT
jgi:hypothetical protein